MPDSHYLDSVKIKIDKSFYLFFAISFVVLISAYSVSREVASDSEVYYEFYNKLIADGMDGAKDCQSFEPLYCTGSYAITKITGADWLTHYVWILTYYLLMLVAFLKFWGGFNSFSKYSIASFLGFVFISINYVEPQQIAFLLRQYVASSLLVVGIALLMLKKNPLVPTFLAVLLHFGALPIALAILAFSKIRFFLGGVLLAVLSVLFAYLTDPYTIEIFTQSVLLKIDTYVANNTSGDVSLIQEVKLILYLALIMYAFRDYKSVWRLYLAIYGFYLLTFPYDLFHLRYYKYLEAMIWPGIFFMFGRIFPPAVKRFHITTAMLYLRLLKKMVT